MSSNPNYPYQQPPQPMQPGMPVQPGMQPMQPGMPMQPGAPVLPYRAPGVMGGPVVCPQCGSPYNKPVGFTWWGGIIGPKLLHHVKCMNCNKAYNGKTGRDNTNGIIIYTVWPS